MKKYIVYILVCAAIGSGCTDILNKEDPSAISPEIWDNERSATLYINALYDKVIPEENFAENADASDEAPGGNDKIYGELTVSSIGLYSLSYYEQIRNINIAIQEAKNGNMSPEAKERILGQVYFMRAFAYWRLVKRYGGVPYIKKPIDPFAGDISFPRTPTSESINLIVADLDTAQAYLPASWPSDERGRITRGAAAALKGKVLLYWASPQFNPSGNQERWQRAYIANKEAKQLLDQDGYGLYEDFGSIFIDEGNKGVILAKLYSSQTERVHGWEGSVRPPAVQGEGNVNPTWELVKAFPMENGLAIDDPSAGYDSTHFYKNRDPRFYATIAYNGAPWTFAGYPADRRQWHYYVDGTSVEPSGGTNTGFYCRKMVNPAIPTEDISETGTDWIIMRYAEVLLNLAEAANATGHPQEAYNLLIAIRERAGIEPGSNGLYGLQAGMGREQMIDAIMLERQIEFAFENKRYWDLRRRNLFAKKFNGTRRHGLRINLKESADPEAFQANRNSMDLDQAYSNYFTGELLVLDQEQAINFPQPQYNFFAIPVDILERSPAVEQTQGWNGGTFDPLQ